MAERSVEREPFTDTDVAVLLRTAGGTDWQGAVLVAAWTGLRLADVAGLTWGNIDLAAGILAKRSKRAGMKEDAFVRKLIRDEEIITGADLSAWADRHAGDERLRITLRQ